MQEAEDGSRDATGLKLNLAVNYGGRNEITAAVKKLAELAASGKIRPADIDETLIEACLYTAGQPDPDIIIRPSGEQRVSNFLTWQSVYSEFLFFDVLWPDFKPKHIDLAIDRFNQRDRRYGDIDNRH